MTHFLLFNPYVAYAFYGGILAYVCWLAWRSRFEPVQMLAALCAIGWAKYVILLIVAGHTKIEVACDASVDAGLCLVAANLARWGYNAAWSVVGLYIAACGISFGAVILGLQGTVAYSIAVNLIFLLRMYVVGADARTRRNRDLRPGRVLPGHVPG